MELPANFTVQMQELLGEEYEDYRRCLLQKNVQGIRVNTAKLSAEEFQKRSPFALTPVPWTKNGFYVDAGEPVTRHPYYYAGLYYVQEPSAMLPAALLCAAPGERVLDLCAAPGGKATELGSRLAGEGLLVANDVSASRAKALLKNLELHGIGNLLVCSEKADRLAQRYRQFFDKILVDAPCSGEGMFRKEPAMRKIYAQKGPAFYAPLQAEILEAAVSMLRPGGRLVYSTCTFSRTENEDVLQSLLAAHPEMRLLPVPQIEGAVTKENLPGCMRLYPHRVRGEGHFAALLQKAGSADGARTEAPRQANGGRPSKPPRQWQEFAARYLKRSFAGWQLFCRAERLYALPESAAIKEGVRYLRTGLYLGDCQKHGFVPSQALAMFLRQCEMRSSLSLAAGDERVLRYLKGETVTLGAQEMQTLDQWTLVCVDGFPLGWAKRLNDSLRNKYYIGWRWNG